MGAEAAIPARSRGCDVAIYSTRRWRKRPSIFSIGCKAILGVGLVERAALIAAVLAHVREDDRRKKVAAAAGEKSGDHPLLHPLRLRRLFAARIAPECLIAFRRLVALLGKEANVADLAEGLFDWPDEIRGDKWRTRWAFDYYGAGSAAPAEDDQAAA